MFRHLQPDLSEPVPAGFSESAGYVLVVIIVALLLLAIFVNPALPA